MSTSDKHTDEQAAHALVIETTGPDETIALGARLAARLGPGDCVALIGELGAGKTQLAKGIAQGLDIDPREVTSPTFVLHSAHQGRLTLHHVDAYRMKSAAELDDLALTDFLDAGGVAVIEWADRVRDALPARRLEITMEHAGHDRRRLSFRAIGTPGTAVDSLAGQTDC